MTNEINRAIQVPRLFLSERVAEARKNARLIREASNSIARRLPPPNLSKVSSAVTGVTKERKDPGKKITTVGTALLILPEPVTSAAAIPILLIGRAMSSNRGANINEIYSELNRSLKDISGAI